MESWKDVKGYEEQYEISSLGRIRNKGTGYVSLGTATGNGYLKHILCRGKKEHKKFYMHRLVADAFIENPLGLKEVNHIDGNRSNNCVSNLEWVSSSGNTDHAIKTGALVPWNRKRKPVIATEISTGKTFYFESISKAEIYYKTKHIDKVLSGERKSAKGHTFRYADEGGDVYVSK